jgi:hypothetical protein
VALSALVITVLGFAATLFQLARTRRAADAAANAVANAERRMARSYMLVLLPQLTRAESELDDAVAQGSQDGVVRGLSAWRWQAGQMRGFLATDEGDRTELLEAIQLSVTLASEAKSRVLNGGDLLKVTAQARAAISSVTGEAGTLTGQYLQIGEIGATGAV